MYLRVVNNQSSNSELDGETEKGVVHAETKNNVGSADTEVLLKFQQRANIHFQIRFQFLSFRRNINSQNHFNFLLFLCMFQCSNTLDLSTQNSGTPFP